MSISHITEFDVSFKEWRGEILSMYQNTLGRKGYKKVGDGIPTFFIDQEVDTSKVNCLKFSGNVLRLLKNNFKMKFDVCNVYKFLEI